jgi:acyl-CoA thioesterase I
VKILIYLLVFAAVIVVLRLGELYTQIARYQKFWDYQNSRPLSKDEIVYVALGDSVAQGIGASKPQKGYVGLVAEYLAESRGKNVHVINLSKSGAKIDDVQSRQLPELERLDIGNQRVITLDIGANDIATFAAADFEREMDELMARLPKDTIIADIPYFGGSRLGKHQPKVEEANQVMSRLADKHGFELANVHENIAKNHGIRTFAADLFHPSDYGYKTNWTPAFIDKIDQSK